MPRNDDLPSMGCHVPYSVCELCGKGHIPSSPPRPESDVIFSLSFVNFSDEQIQKVAEHAGVTPERIRSYLKSDEHNPELFRAVEYITGCCPVGKHL